MDDLLLLVHSTGDYFFQSTMWKLETSIALGAERGQIGVTGLSGVHLRKEAVVFGALQILIMPVSGLHIVSELHIDFFDQLKTETAAPYFTPVATLESPFSSLIIQTHIQNQITGKNNVS